MASVPLENGKEDLHQSGPLNMPHDGGVALNSSNLLRPSQHSMQDNPMQGEATLVPPLASYPPPMGPNFMCIPYMANYTVPTHCAHSENIITNGGLNGSIPECDLDVEEDKKPADKEHKKRSKNWTRPETLRLIKQRLDLASKFNRTGRKSDLWEQIAIALRHENICRDAQQCRDKWEKLMAGYKEVKDGLKDRDEYPFYDELYPLLSGKLFRREKDNIPIQHENEAHEAGAMHAQSSASRAKEAEKEGPSIKFDGGSDEDEDGAFSERPLHKRKRSPKYVAVTDLQAVRALLDMVVSQQQKIFKEFLENLDRKEQQREKARQDREEKWRAEELKQGRILNDTMIVLSQKLVGEGLGATTSAFPAQMVCNQGAQQQGQGSMKRSKNWKRTEVLQLIKLRGEMEAKFAKLTRRAALWDELSDVLCTQEIKRDGKQCREKWDKLMSEYKDVLDGKREPSDSSYYEELKAVFGSRSTDDIG